MLGRDDHGVHAHGLAVLVVFDGDLALGVGAQVGQLLLLTQLGQLDQQLVAEGDGQRHQLGGFVAGVAEHQALVAGALFLVQAFAFVDALADVGALGVQGHQHRAVVGLKADAGFGVADVLDHAADDFLVVDDGLGGDLTGKHHQAGGDHGLSYIGAHGNGFRGKETMAH